MESSTERALDRARYQGPCPPYRRLDAGIVHYKEIHVTSSSGGSPADIVRALELMAAENHNHAAEILESALLDETPEAESASVRTRVRFLNTLIGKMSGMVTDAREAVAQWLATITPQDPRAFLVEAFNRILISRICFDEASGGHRLPRGLTVFKEKGDLLPFEEAKLYGHNWTHALGAYIGTLRGLQQIADLRDFPDILRFLRAGLSRNRGEALIRKHSG